MRARARNLAYWAAVATGWPRRRRRQGGAPVFCFHNVIAAGAAPSGDRSLQVPRDAFARYLDWMAGTYAMVPLDELVRRVAASRPVAGLAAITFDDAYEGVYRHALPELRARGLPATMYVVGNAPDLREPFWWDRAALAGALGVESRRRCLEVLAGDASAIVREIPLAAPDALPDDYRPASWDTIRAGLDTLGAESHTMTHRNLAVLDDDALAMELVEARRLLADRTGRVAAHVAYPYGRWDARVAAAARAAGYSSGSTLEGRASEPGDSPHALSRLNVPSGISLDALECRAAGVPRWKQ